MGGILCQEAGVMHRFYVDQNAPAVSSEVALTPEDARHALKVLRMRPGEEAMIISGGLRFAAELSRIEGNAVFFRVKEPLPSTEPGLRITLFQGLPKGDKMEWIIQKAVELGIAEIVPVRMARSVVRLDAADAEKKRERWQRIAREAGKQSGRCLIPQVALPCLLPDLPARAESLDACAVPWEEAEAGGPRSFFEAHPHLRSLGILIGPEGGIEPAEIRAIAPRFQPITLGSRILRTETAGLACAAAFLGLYGEME